MEWPVFVVCLVFNSLAVSAEPAVYKNPIEIYSLHVDCKVTSRFAHTVITSRVVNRANESKEALFEVELPKTAFITDFSMTIDGVSYPGIIKEKKSAQDQYNAAVSRGQSAGLVKSAGRKLEQFHVSVNVAPAAKVNFELIYEELLKRKLGKYELLIKVKPKQLVNHFQIDTHIFEPQGIRFLESQSTFMTNELNDALTKTQGDTKAHISFKPTINQQRKNPGSEETLLDGDFVIRYDVNRSLAAGDVQIVNGYFVHYFAPNQMPAFPKNVIFVIDKSGSMSGKKIQQTREALEKILEDLYPEDHFNLVVFSAGVAEWQPVLLKATEENVERAKQYVRTIFAQGGTNINGALLTAMHSLDKATSAEILPEESVSMIMLLTDGQPTVGETDIAKIQENIKGANNGKYFLYCLGFGFDVSYSFLEKMALDNGGIARRIYEDSDAALQLQGFYQEVATPILKGIEMKYPDHVQEITQNTFNVLFDGSEIVVAGKLDNDIEVFPVNIKAQANGFNLTLQKDENVMEKEQVFQDLKYIFGKFTERLWAYLTIQQLLEKSVSAKEQEQKSLEAQALNLSLKFSFVTPLTSMVVTKPDAQEVANKPTEADNESFEDDIPQSSAMMYQLQSSRSRSSKRPASRPHGQPGLSGPPPENPSHHMASPYDYSYGGKHFVPGMRLSSPLRKNANSVRISHPHFIVQLPRGNDAICLEVNGQSQTPLNLLSDPVKGIQVTGKLETRKHFEQFEIVYQKPDVRIDVSTQEIVLHLNGNTALLSWKSNATFPMTGLNIAVEEEKSLSLMGADNISIKISYVRLPERFLGLYITDGANFSEQVTGLLGQFYSNTHFEGKHGDASTIIAQGQRHISTRQNKKDYRVESSADNLSCWLVKLKL
ncbi:inter-alpha-trypsin inhibitor heavy chain H4 isoform X1 [Pogona vitticeps]